MKKINPYATVSVNPITAPKKTGSNDPSSKKITSEVDLRVRVNKK